MTNVFITTTNTKATLACVIEGQCIMEDILVAADEHGIIEVDGETFWAMTQDEFDWWERWAEREERIQERAAEIGEEAYEQIAELAVEFGHDFELMQDKEEEVLGIG